MGHDTSTERNDQLALWSAVFALTLAFLVPVFHWYFNTMTDEELAAKVMMPDRDHDGRVDYLAERDQALAEARARLEEAPVSIRAAMDQLASSGRNIPTVRPQPSDGANLPLSDALASLAAVEGWSKRANTEAKEAAERALLRRRAAGVMQRLSQVAVEATDLKLDAEAEQANALRLELQSRQDIETLTRAEAWLAGWPARRGLAATAG